MFDLLSGSGDTYNLDFSDPPAMTFKEWKTDVPLCPDISYDVVDSSGTPISDPDCWLDVVGSGPTAHNAIVVLGDHPYLKTCTVRATAVDSGNSKTKDYLIIVCGAETFAPPPNNMIVMIFDQVAGGTESIFPVTSNWWTQQFGPNTDPDCTIKSLAFYEDDPLTIDFTHPQITINAPSSPLEILVD